ncbi:MAG TPA: hypothetical protein VHZ49_07770 [Methylomirabilota bacterium]|jgi:hypothetical protein|nr:hypothetical protein [Methylomirabilota bacterium]
MRSVFVALVMTLVLALGVLEVLASRVPVPEYPTRAADSFAIWHAR